MRDELIISAYGSHNAAIAMYYKGNYKVVEVERWLNEKNIGLTNYMPSRMPQIVFDEICDYLLGETNRSDVDIFLTDYMNLKPKFHYKQHLNYDHHMAHAATAFYQSPYKNSLVITFDGGGDGAYFNIYLANRNNDIKLLDKFNQDLGFPYMVLGDYLKDIKKESLSIGNLVYAGKIMGLASYGTVNEKWLPYFDDFYSKFNYYGNSYIGGAEARYNALTELFKNIGFDDFDFENSRYDGQEAWDIAATSQKAFENQFFKFAKPYLDKYPDMPVAMAGGCALNVLLNSKLLKMRNNKVFVPPNVNDCGIAVGGLLNYLKPETQVDLTYSGLPILDDMNFSSYIQDRSLIVYENIGAKELAEYLSKGSIVGVVQGNSEHGSRALGNRSILCNPVGNMKQILNDKVKHREWYRPFAPICKLEDTSKYFYFDENVESRHMTFVAEVRDEWKEKLPAITHEDGSSRLQTVTSKQNELIYDLLTEFEKITGHGVLLNTSFNVNGKPILTRLSDALLILQQSEMDAVFYKNNLILKSAKDNYKDLIVEKIKDKRKKDVTVYFSSFPENNQDRERDINLINEICEKYNDRICLVIERKEYEEYFNRLNNKIVFYYVINERQHYYKERLTKRFSPTPKTTLDFSKIIKLFWNKEVMYNNPNNSEYGLFIDLQEYFSKNYDYDIKRDWSILKQFAKNDDYILMSSKKETDSIFTKEFLENKFSIYPEKFPTTAIIGGNFENCEWLFNNYEGVLLWYMEMDKIGKPNDYLIISSIENKSRFNFLD